MRRLLAVLALSLVLGVGTAGAQGGQSAPVPHPTLFALNPIGALLGYYSVNVEQAFRVDQTFGFSAAYVEPTLRDDNYDGTKYEFWSTDLKYRYYPRAVYHGLSVGASVGMAGVRRDTREYVFNGGVDGVEVRTRRSGSGPTFGFELGYNWLLGDAERLHIGLGVGAKRYFTTSGDNVGSNGSSFALPTGRLSLGLVF